MTLSLRPVSLADADRLLAWRNDEATRLNSFRPEPVPAEAHADWLWRRLHSADYLGLVLEADAVPVAVVWYERQGDYAEVSVTVAPEHRGHGYGERALRLSAWEACQKLGVRRLRALVFADNLPSLAAFAKAGYDRQGRACFVLEREGG